MRTRTTRGEWLALDTGVYGHRAAPPSWERSVAAAVLAEPWAAASHRSAAVLHKLPGFRPGRPEITVRPGANARGRLAVVHRGIDVRTTTVLGIPTVTVEQAFVDLAQTVSELRLRTALAAAADRSPRVLDGVRDRYCALAPRGGRDLRPLRAVLLRFGAGDATDRTALEAQLAALLQALPVPVVDWEAPFPGRRPGTARVDALDTAPGASSSKPTGGPGTPASTTSSRTGDAMPRRPLRASSRCASPGTSSPRTSDGSAASCWRPGPGVGPRLRAWRALIGPAMPPTRRRPEVGGISRPIRATHAPNPGCACDRAPS